MEKLEQALKEALDREHTCRSNTCDIARAIEEGFYVYAAYVLSCATECEATTVAANALNQALGPDEYEKRLQHESSKLWLCPHLDCPDCGAIIWTEEDSAHCDNCGANVVADESAEAVK